MGTRRLPLTAPLDRRALAHLATRRHLLHLTAGLGLAAAGAPLLNSCEPPSRSTKPLGKVYRVGSLTPLPPPTDPSRPGGGYSVFLDAMRELGWIEGQTVIYEHCWANWDDARLDTFAQELAKAKVDVIFSGTTPASLAARRATTTIPIVQPQMLDPIGSGLVASLARPGGNVTGGSFVGSVLSGKRMEFLLQVVSAARHIGILWSAANPAAAFDFENTREAVMAAGLTSLSLPVGRPEDFDEVFATLRDGQSDALLVLPEHLTGSNSRRIIEFCAHQRLPAMYGEPGPVRLGGLMTYAPNGVELFRNAAGYVNRILRGTKPADLPVYQPTKFELGINLKTAQALGLTVPQSVLIQATEVIE
jgi:putative tryptophan/tyrosine transport system substrate-binding protein